MAPHFLTDTKGAHELDSFERQSREGRAAAYDRGFAKPTSHHRGWTPRQLIELPPALENAWHTHGYYGGAMPIGDDHRVLLSNHGLPLANLGRALA